MENNKVEVKINNMEYTIVSNESEEYVQRVALLVNKKISEVKSQAGQLSTAMLAVMAALNLADDFLKSEMTVDNLRSEMTKYMEESQNSGSELSEKKLEVENLKEDLHKLEIELAKRETEIENLRGISAKTMGGNPGTSSHSGTAANYVSQNQNGYPNGRYSYAQRNSAQSQNTSSFRTTQGDESTKSY